MGVGVVAQPCTMSILEAWSTAAIFFGGFKVWRIYERFKFWIYFPTGFPKPVYFIMLCFLQGMLKALRLTSQSVFLIAVHMRSILMWVTLIIISAVIIYFGALYARAYEFIAYENQLRGPENS